MAVHKEETKQTNTVETDRMPMAAPAAGQQHTQERSLVKQQEEKKQSRVPVDPKRDKKGAYWAFHLTNFLGLHFLFNSTLSVFIAYNLLPTKGAKALMGWAAKVATPIYGGWMKATNPIRKAIQGPAFKTLAKDAMKAKIAHSARSRVETAFMCIAGFVALWPVKWLEDHRAWFMNKVDNLLHPGRSSAERAAKELHQEDMPKETWWNLTRARFVGLAAVFTTDALQQRFNNMLTYEKGNVDTVVWKWAANFSEKVLPKSWRSWLVDTFSAKNITLSKIQTDIDPKNDMRGHLLKTIESPKHMQTVSKKMTKLQDQMLKTTNKATLAKLEKQVKKLNDGLMKKFKPQVERAIFAEQGRLLLTKEIFLTLLISAVIYICAKAPFMAKLFEKIGLQKKGTFEAHHAKKHAEEGSHSAPPEKAAIEEKGRFASAVGQRKPMTEPAELHSDKVLTQPENQPQLAI